MKYNRIWIFGGTGGGKTTFSKKLSKKTGLVHHNTDFMKYSKNFKRKYTEAYKRRKIIELSKRKSWICEGSHLSDWIWPALKKTDLVVILKVNPFRRFIRLFKRELFDRKRKFTFSKACNLSYHIFLYNFRNYWKHRSLAKRFGKKFIVLKSNKEINSFLEEFR